MTLYHLSQDPTLSKLTPRVPECAVPCYEDCETPRVCFAPTIAGCLSALQSTDSEYYVYTPAQEDLDFYTPSTQEVIDSSLTGEVWIFQDVDLICLGKISTKDLHRTTNEIEVVDRQGRKSYTRFHEYEWSWI